MRTIHSNDRGFSLLEILLAAIIFVLSVAGIFATLNTVRGPVTDKENALSATVFGKQVLEALRSQVNASTYYNTACLVTNNGDCGDFNFVLGTHQVALPWPANCGQSGQPACLVAAMPSNLIGSNPPGGSITYTVSCGDGTYSTTTCGADTARVVTLTVNWPKI